VRPREVSGGRADEHSEAAAPSGEHREPDRDEREHDEHGRSPALRAEYDSGEHDAERLRRDGHEPRHGYRSDEAEHNDKRREDGDACDVTRLPHITHDESFPEQCSLNGVQVYS
jgi:hypothetical protein